MRRWRPQEATASPAVSIRRRLRCAKHSAVPPPPTPPLDSPSSCELTDKSHRSKNNWTFKQTDVVLVVRVHKTPIPCEPTPSLARGREKGQGSATTKKKIIISTADDGWLMNNEAGCNLISTQPNGTQMGSSHSIYKCWKNPEDCLSFR